MHQHHAGAARFYAFAGYQLDLRRMGLLREGRELKLRPKSFDVLRYLVEHAGAVVTKDELLGHVWADTAVTEDALVQCLVDIRRALGAEGSRLVRTVPRRGYLFEADVKVLDVDAVGMVVNASSPASPAAGSLAVLPFHPLAKDESDHFELGLTDALITRLSMARGLVVRPWTSVQLYIASTKDPIQVGGELGVESVLEGTVQRVDARIRVTGRLYRAADGRLLWWGTFDDDASDALAVQDSISEKVARALYVELGQKPRPRVPREAFEAYARGRYFFERYTREGNTKAVEYFEQATALAPDFALAHAALAVNYGPMLVRGFISLEDALPKLESAAHRAMELDDTLPEANLAMAELHGRLGRWDASERFYRRALELNPNLLTAWGHYTFLLHALGRHEEGLAGSARLLEMDPVSDYGGKDHANSLIWMGRYDEALEQAKRAVELRPDFGPAHWVLARAYESLNRLEDAHRHFTLAGDKVSAALIRAREGDRRPACALLEALRGSQDADLQLQLASLHAGLGNREEGVAALESAAAAYDYRPSHMTLMYLAVDRRFAPFRDDPRFRELVARLGLPRRW